MVMVTRSDLLLRIEDKKYPLTLEDIRQENPLISFGEELDEETLLDMGYALVHPTEQPTGDVVTEGTPVEREEGGFLQQWTVRAFNEEESADRLKVAIDQYVRDLDRLVESELAVGIPYDFNGETYHLQIREKDKPNLIALNGKALRAVNGGYPETPMVLRPYENITLTPTAQEMLDATDHVLTEMERFYQRYWAVKDAAEAAPTEDQIPALPETLLA